MRVKQLAGHMRRFHGDTYDVAVAYVSKSWRAAARAWLTTRFPDAVFLFSKFAAAGWSGDDFQSLGRRAAAVMLDYVDAPVERIVHHGIDGHIVATRAGAHLWARQFELEHEAGRPVHGEIVTVLHNHDVALDGITARAPSDRLAMCYLGTPAQTVVTPRVDREVTFLPGETPEEFSASMGRVGCFNAHYAVRRNRDNDGQLKAKPFTKGATAAACGAVLMTDRDTDDAVAFLGEDYPFLIPDITPGSIDAGLTRIKDAFGGAEWDLAVSRMANIRNATSHRAVSGQLHAAIQSLI